MASNSPLCSCRFLKRIDAEDLACDLLLRRSIGAGIKKLQVEYQMGHVVACEAARPGGFIGDLGEACRRHAHLLCPANFAGTVEVRRTSRAIEISIDDKGAGIPQQEFTPVLEPFSRLDESRSRETGRVGLGFAIAQSIVQTHGGTFTLSNRPEAGLLRTTIALPLSESALTL